MVLVVNTIRWRFFLRLVRRFHQWPLRQQLPQRRQRSAFGALVVVWVGVVCARQCLERRSRIWNYG